MNTKEFEERAAEDLQRQQQEAVEEARRKALAIKIAGAVLLAALVGVMSGSMIAVLVVLALFGVPIWQSYSGSVALEKPARVMRRGLWGALAVVAVIVVVGNLMHSPEPSEPVASLTPEQKRHSQVQALVNRLEAHLVEHIKSSMHDPGSFEIADETVTDRGSYVIVHIRFRGKNPMGATVLASAVIAADLDGTVRVLEVRN